MSENTNTLSEGNPSARPQKALSKTERSQDILLVLSVAQLITAMLLYLLEDTKIITFVLEILVVIGLALLAHFKYEVKVARILLRIVDIVLIVVPILFSAIFMVFYYTEAIASQAAMAMVQFQTDFWKFYAIIVLPFFLFMQPVFIINAVTRRRFDMVILRIVTIITLLLSVILCILGFEYRPDGEQVILTSQSFSLNLFSSTQSFTIAIDSIFTRILFCLFSAALVVLSFLIHSNRKDKTKS